MSTPPGGKRKTPEEQPDMNATMSHASGQYRQHLRTMRCTSLEMAGLVEDMISSP